MVQHIQADSASCMNPASTLRKGTWKREQEHCLHPCKELVSENTLRRESLVGTSYIMKGKGDTLAQGAHAIPGVMLTVLVFWHVWLRDW
eukprot:scaffold209429_cov14-Tisochrysis_lutea.AAC.1